MSDLARVFVGRQSDNLENSILDALGWINWENLINRDTRVFIKPNLTYPSPKPGVTTTPKFIEAVIKAIKTRTNHIVIGESDGGYRAWPAELSFHSHGLPEICEKNHIKLVNLSKEPSKEVYVDIGKPGFSIRLPKLLLDNVDVFITLPVPKIHTITLMSGAIKNQWGCIPDNMRIVYHPYFDKLILEINRKMAPHIALADGTYFLNRNGPMDGDEVRMDMLMASDSLGAMDYTICRVMGLNFSRVRHLQVAKQLGWIPELSQIQYNQSPDIFAYKNFYLKRSVRNWVVWWAFDHPWAIKLFWNSWFADLAHKIFYAVAGNQVKDSVKRVQIK